MKSSVSWGGMAKSGTWGAATVQEDLKAVCADLAWSLVSS